MLTIPPRSDADDATELGMRLATACAPAFVMCRLQLPPAEQVEFIGAFLAAVSGMTQQAVGQQATADLFASIAGLPAVGPGGLGARNDN